MFKDLLRRLRDYLNKLVESKETTPSPIPEEQDGSGVNQNQEITTIDEDTMVVIDGVVPVLPVEPVVEPEVPPTPTRTPRYLWCLDNGHGVKTAGKRSPVFDDGVTQLLEYEFNRDIVVRIAKRLDEEGLRYFDVVPDVDQVGDFLDGRVHRANIKASDIPKVFVSVHSNAGPVATPNDWCAPSISGIETWHYHTSVKGKAIAAVFQQHLIQETGWKNRHLKSRPERQFVVLEKTTMPAILTENGFFNNKEQALELMKPDVRQRIAEAHVKAILEIENSGI
jgi:N-acetylmuramoyl-L-alanine amidase